MLRKQRILLINYLVVAIRVGKNFPKLFRARFLRKITSIFQSTCWLAPIEHSIWNYLSLLDVCYLVADLPCQSEIITYWNYQPCSVAAPPPVTQVMSILRVFQPGSHDPILPICCYIDYAQIINGYSIE